VNVLAHQPRELTAAFRAKPPAKPKGVRFVENRSDEERADAKGRVSVYEAPREGRRYTLGFDTAKGLAGRDLSVCSVWDKTSQKEGDGTAKQVCEAAGHWGGECFHRLVFALHMWYNGAFIMGEAQDEGLATLRMLVDDYEVRYLYYDKTQGNLAAIASRNPRLGWNRTANDVTLTHFVEQIRARKLLIRSPELLEQMGRYKWKARSKGAEKDERVGDGLLVAKLDGGGSPDILMGALYGVFALTQVVYFEAEKPKPEALAFYGLQGVPQSIKDALKPGPPEDGPRWVSGGRV
jgi:hypothetical protein